MQAGASGIWKDMGTMLSEMSVYGNGNQIHEKSIDAGLTEGQ